MWDVGFFLELAYPIDDIWTFERDSNTRLQKRRPDHKWRIIGTNQHPIKYYPAHFYGDPMENLRMPNHSIEDIMLIHKLLGISPIQLCAPVIFQAMDEMPVKEWKQ
jgi:hypothetical protein